jgi:N-acyl-D-aspartate/D-glutamate deacylase
MTYDLVIRNGTVVDGSGAPRYRADVAVADGRIVEIGRIAASGREELDADGLFVTPGFIDNHTHLDAQICWDPFGPAARHGVTSIVAGNCGIGVAPCRDERDRENFILPALETAEDIHRPTVEAGVSWEWESFADYLQFVERLPKGVNFGANVAHGSLRSYVMGDRAYDRDAATDDDVAAISRELDASLRAGALGFTSMLPGASMFLYYGDLEPRDQDPRIVCGLATPQEVEAITEVLVRFGRGSIQLGGAYWDDAVQLSARTGLSVQFVFGTSPPSPDFTLQHFDDAAALGAKMIPSVSARPQTTVVGFRARLPFDSLPVWKELRARPLEEQRAALLDPVRRAQLIETARTGEYPRIQGLAPRAPEWEKLSILDRPLPPFDTVADRAAARGADPYDVFLDLCLESDFHRLFSQPGTWDHPRETWLELLRHPRSVISQNDTGAHTAQAADWVMPTWFLGYWVRQEEEFSWEEGVRMLTSDPAAVWGGLGGRGLLHPGAPADVNVFDPATVSPAVPDADNGLPGGGKRLTCDAVGMVATVVGGRVTFREGVHTGNLPGSLLTT